MIVSLGRGHIERLSIPLAESIFANWACYRVEIFIPFILLASVARVDVVFHRVNG